MNMSVIQPLRDRKFADETYILGNLAPGHKVMMVLTSPTSFEFCRRREQVKVKFSPFPRSKQPAHAWKMRNSNNAVPQAFSRAPRLHHIGMKNPF